MLAISEIQQDAACAAFSLAFQDSLALPLRSSLLSLPIAEELRLQSLRASERLTVPEYIAGSRSATPWRRRCSASTSQIATYPLVTTGGGALPLPTCAQPAMLRRANTAAVARASFFMKLPPCHDTRGKSLSYGAEKPTAFVICR